MAKIEDLVPDIQRLFTHGVEVKRELVDAFAKDVAETVTNRLTEYGKERGKRSIRISNLDKPNRQLWYEVNAPEVKREEMSASALIKFLYGDLLEHLLLFLAEAAGHTVEHQQKEIVVDGVVGHIDAVIDSVVVDVKSASTFAFLNFEKKLDPEDPFSYIFQIAGYMAAEEKEGAFLVIDKTLGHIKLVQVGRFDKVDVHERIREIQEMLLGPIPERCYEPKPMGKSGNMELAIGCQYCSMKEHCWSDANNGQGIRTFLYSNGPAFLVAVHNEPKVFEATK